MRTHLLICACCAVLLITAGCKGQQSVITPEQAMDAVRAFEGDNNLQLQCSEIQEYSSEHNKVYEVEDTPSSTASWNVDAVTGEVTFALYYDAVPDEPTEDPAGPLTEAQCRQIAEDFACAKYSGFDTMGFQMQQPEWEDGGWNFFWQQQVAYGAWTPNHVSVDVNPVDGRIQHYGCSRIVPTPTPQQPLVTAQEAIAAFKTATGMVTVYDEPQGPQHPDYPTLRVDPDGTYWDIALEGENSEGKRFVRGANVNAVTGEVFDVSKTWVSSRGPKPAAARSAALTGDPVYVRDLTAKVPGAKVHWLGKEGARVFVGKNRYTLVPGRDTVEWTGGTSRSYQIRRRVQL